MRPVAPGALFSHSSQLVLYYVLWYRTYQRNGGGLAVKFGSGSHGGSALQSNWIDELRGRRTGLS